MTEPAGGDGEDEESRHERGDDVEEQAEPKARRALHGLERERGQRKRGDGRRRESNEVTKGGTRVEPIFTVTVNVLRPVCCLTNRAAAWCQAAIKTAPPLQAATAPR